MENYAHSNLRPDQNMHGRNKSLKYIFFIVILPTSLIRIINGKVPSDR